MISKIIAEAEIQKAKKYIDYVDKIVIVTHISPDGDAIGSSLGLYHFLLEMDKQVNVIVPNDFPEFLKWMKGAHDIIIHEKNPQIAEETIAAAELIFCLDLTDYFQRFRNDRNRYFTGHPDCFPIDIHPSRIFAFQLHMVALLDLTIL